MFEYTSGSAGGAEWPWRAGGAGWLWTAGGAGWLFRGPMCIPFLVFNIV